MAETTRPDAWIRRIPRTVNQCALVELIRRLAKIRDEQGVRISFHQRPDIFSLAACKTVVIAITTLGSEMLLDKVVHLFESLDVALDN